MTVMLFENTAIVLERVVAVEFDEPCAGDESVRVFLSGMNRPVELFVPDPEATCLQICAALSRLTCNNPGSPTLKAT